MEGTSELSFILCMDTHPILGSPILRTSSSPRYLPKILPPLNSATMGGRSRTSPSALEGGTDIQCIYCNSSCCISGSINPLPTMIKTGTFLQHQQEPPPVLLPSATVLRVCIGDGALGRSYKLRPVTDNLMVPNPQHDMGCLVANVSPTFNQLHPFPASLPALLPQ